MKRLIWRRSLLRFVRNTVCIFALDEKMKRFKKLKRSKDVDNLLQLRGIVCLLTHVTGVFFWGVTILRRGAELNLES